MRKKIIAGNWKMNTTAADAAVLAHGVVDHAEHMDKVKIILCPPTIWLTEVAHIVPSNLSNVKVGAQNMYFETHGAFTGEVSPTQIKEVAKYVIIGHSERTHLFGEKPELIADKLRAAFDYGLIPILCIGEDKKVEGSIKKLVQELNFLVREIKKTELDEMVLAYEPVWAIGSGNPATPEYAQEVIKTLRSVLTDKTRILYGGSVDENNAKGFLTQPDIDGLLIGGTSLKLKPFVTIAQYADDI